MGDGDGVRLGGRRRGQERLAGPKGTLLQGTFQLLVGAIVAGGCGYYVLVLLAVRGFLGRRGRKGPPPRELPSISVLKPLAGDEPGLAENLESFLEIDFPDHEILFAARSGDDPALALAHSLAQRHPKARSKVLVAGEAACPNLKVHSLAEMTRVSSGDVLVISDSDIRTDQGLLDQVARDFSDPTTGVVTYPYRAVPGRSVWSLLEALGMNTGFWSGVLAAQFLAPMDFAVGPTMAIRRSGLEAIGGWDAVKDVLAEDFRIGGLARKAGYDVRLGTHVVEHRIGSQGLAANLAHRLRWSRSTRRSRPVGYFGEIFANPLPWAILLAAASATTWAWALFASCVSLRLAVLFVVGRLVLRDTLVLRFWWLVPLQDVLALMLWVGGFFGTTIIWRSRKYRLTRDGKLKSLDS